MRLLHVDKVVKELSTENSDARIVQSVESVMRACSKDMLEFAGEVIRCSMDTLSMQPPCDFSIVAIGSLARGEATPYSDLEYLFLIEKASGSVYRYFEK